MNEDERAHLPSQIPPELTGIQVLVNSIIQGIT